MHPFWTDNNDEEEEFRRIVPAVEACSNVFDEFEESSAESSRYKLDGV